MNKKAIYQAQSIMRHLIEFEAAHLTNDKHHSDLVNELRHYKGADDMAQIAIDFYDCIAVEIDSSI